MTNTKGLAFWLSSVVLALVVGFMIGQETMRERVSFNAFTAGVADEMERTTMEQFQRSITDLERQNIPATLAQTACQEFVRTLPCQVRTDADKLIAASDPVSRMRGRTCKTTASLAKDVCKANLPD